MSTSIFPCQLPLTLKTYVMYMSYALLSISNLLFILSLVALDIWGLDSGISYISLVKILESLGRKLTSIQERVWREDLFE